MWKYATEPERRQMKIWRMGISCWTTKAKTHTQNM